MRFRERRSRRRELPFEAPEEGPAAVFALNAGSAAAELVVEAGASLTIGAAGAAITAPTIFGSIPPSGALGASGGATNAPRTSASPAPAPRLLDGLDQEVEVPPLDVRRLRCWMGNPLVPVEDRVLHTRPLAS
jgi:hypothetical protein